MKPKVTFRKQDGNTGVVRPGNIGILAIVAASLSGSVNEPTMHVDESLAHDEFSWGPLTEFAGYAMPETGHGALLCRPTTTTAGAYSAIVKTGGGTAAPASTASTHPYDDFDVLITFPTGGALGTGGITYDYSLDGGKTTSAVQALGTDLVIAIPDTGISVTLGTSTQTILANETITFTTTRPLATNADLPATLEALRTTSSPFEAVLFDAIADDDTVALLATWLLDLNNRGKFPEVFVTSRPQGATESPTDYKTALAAVFASSACVDAVVCADEDDIVSPFRGISMVRPTGLATAARSMAVDIGVEPAYVNLGPLTGVRITDAKNNPRHHDEDKFEGLDDLRLTTHRTLEGFEGVYITNTNLLSPSGSDFVYLPHARVMNAACAIAYQILTKQLSVGVAKNPKPGPLGERYIAEHAAALIEGLVNIAIGPTVKGNVDDMRFRMSRLDDIGSNAGAKVKCFMEAVSLSYIKEFDVTARYVRQLPQSA